MHTHASTPRGASSQKVIVRVIQNWRIETLTDARARLRRTG